MVFSFLKNILKKDFVKEVKEELLDFNDIRTWIKNKELELKDKEQKVLDSIHVKINLLNTTSNEKLIILNDFNFEATKSDDRVRSIVKDSLMTYIASVKRLIKSVNDLPYKDLEDYAFKMEKLFTDFFKKSQMSYQKSTFLVGKEILAVKNVLIKFYKQQKNIFESDEKIILITHALSVIQLKLDLIEENKKSCKELSDKTKALNKKIKEEKNKSKTLSKDLEQLKTSKKYSDNIEKEKNVESGKSYLKMEYLNLKRLVNFKALANEFHSSTKHMLVVKSFKNHFITAIKQDSTSLIKLLDEAKLSSDLISSKILKLSKYEKDLLKKEASIKHGFVSDILNDIKKSDAKVDSLNDEKSKEQTILEKLSASKESLIEHIKEELLSIDVVFKK
jgi:hypothetical protein